MLKVNFVYYDDEYGDTDKGTIVLDDNFEIPNTHDIQGLYLYLEDFITYRNPHEGVHVSHTEEITQEQCEKDGWDVPTKKEILIAVSKIEKYEDMGKYGLIEGCPLCGRNIPTKHRSKHHLIPVAENGRHEKKVVIHKICHSKIHSVFTEEELALKYNTIEKLKPHEDIQKFIKWVQNKPENYYDSSKMKRSRKDRRFVYDLI